MECKDIKEILTQYSLVDLQDAEKEEVQSHLRSCGDCESFVSQSNELWNLLDGWEGVEPDSQYLAKFWDKASVDEPELKPGFLSWIRDIRLNWTLAGAMASIFLVSIITFAAFSPDTRNSLLLSSDERDELVLIELDNALSRETAEVLSIYGPWDGSSDFNTNGGMN